MSAVEDIGIASAQRISPTVIESRTGSSGGEPIRRNPTGLTRLEGGLVIEQEPDGEESQSVKNG